MCQTTALFFVPLVPGFSTASYLKVHIKTHHGSPLPPSATMHTFPEPRGELQMHNGNPYHMGRQCSVEGKQSPAPIPSVHVSGFSFALLLFLEKHSVQPLFMFENEHICCQALRSHSYCNYTLVIFLLTEVALYAQPF